MRCKETTIGSIASVQTGPFGSQLHNKDYVLVGTPMVTVEHLGDRRMTRQNLPCISDADKERLSKYTLEYGDLVFSRVGSVDRCSWVSEAEEGWLFSGRCLRVRPNSSDEIYHKYLYYFFCLESTKKFIRNVAVGATMPSINTHLLSEVPINYPSIELQHRIGDTLSVLDDVIENNNRINHHLEQMAQAIFKSWFVDFEPWGGVMPSDWREGCLGDIADVSSGKRPLHRQPQPSKEASIPLVGASSIMGYTNTLLYNEKIIVTGRVGTHGVIQRFSDACWASDNTLVLKSRFYEYTYQQLHRVDFHNLNRGSTQPLITQSDLLNVYIIIPSDSILSTFEDTVGAFMKHYEANIAENRRLAALRDTLLPRLMSGELSVADL